MSAQYREGIGSMIDKLSILNLKIWHHEEICYDEKSTIVEVGEAKKAINSLNTQRTAIVEAIDELFFNVVTGKEPPPMLTPQHKKYTHAAEARDKK